MIYAKRNLFVTVEHGLDSGQFLQGRFCIRRRSSIGGENVRNLMIDDGKRRACEEVGVGHIANLAHAKEAGFPQ